MHNTSSNEKILIYITLLVKLKEGILGERLDAAQRFWAERPGLLPTDTILLNSLRYSHILLNRTNNRPLIDRAS